MHTRNAKKKKKKMGIKDAGFLTELRARFGAQSGADRRAPWVVGCGRSETKRHGASMCVFDAMATLFMLAMTPGRGGGGGAAPEPMRLSGVVGALQSQITGFLSGVRTPVGIFVLVADFGGELLVKREERKARLRAVRAAGERPYALPGSGEPDELTAPPWDDDSEVDVARLLKSGPAFRQLLWTEIVRRLVLRLSVPAAPAGLGDPLAPGSSSRLGTGRVLVVDAFPGADPVAVGDTAALVATVLSAHPELCDDDEAAVWRLMRRDPARFVEADLAAPIHWAHDVFGPRSGICTVVKGVDSDLIPITLLVAARELEEERKRREDQGSPAAGVERKLAEADAASFFFPHDSPLLTPSPLAGRRLLVWRTRRPEKRGAPRRDDVIDAHELVMHLVRRGYGATPLDAARVFAELCVLCGCDIGRPKDYALKGVGPAKLLDAVEHPCVRGAEAGDGVVARVASDLALAGLLHKGALSLDGLRLRPHSTDLSSGSEDDLAWEDRVRPCSVEGKKRKRPASKGAKRVQSLRKRRLERTPSVEDALPRYARKQASRSGSERVLASAAHFIRDFRSPTKALSSGVAVVEKALPDRAACAAAQAMIDVGVRYWTTGHDADPQAAAAQAAEEVVRAARAARAAQARP